MPARSEQPERTAEAAQPSFAEAFPVWLKIGLLSFGGPAGQIATMHREYVDERKWIDEQRYLHALNFCMLLPGPEAMQLATYVGWKQHGIRGGLASGLLFVLPGALVMLVLAALYAAFGKLPIAEAVFLGIKAAVLAVVVEALLRIARRGLKSNFDRLLAAAAFAAIFLLRIPYPLIVLAAVAIGFWRGRGDESARPAGTAPLDLATRPSARRTLTTALVWLMVWIGPLAGIALIFGRDHVLARLGWFFSKLAVVTFGGAYAVLAYMAQDVVSAYGWLTAGQMMDGLGLAETTPGPLILVTEFVGFLAAHQAGGASPYVMGVLGAIVAVWATFAPCFLWIFTGAPYVERLQAEPRLKAALAGVMAAVVGVIMNLTVWFALNVLFGRVGETAIGPARLYIPELATVSWPAVLLSALAFVLMFGLHRGMITTLGVCAGLALGWHYIG